jgi:hypothetical protein
MSWEWKDRPKKEGETLDIPTRKEFKDLEWALHETRCQITGIEVGIAKSFDTAFEVRALQNLVTEIEHELQESIQFLIHRVELLEDWQKEERDSMTRIWNAIKSSTDI